MTQRIISTWPLAVLAIAITTIALATCRPAEAQTPPRTSPAAPPTTATAPPAASQTDIHAAPSPYTPTSPPPRAHDAHEHPRLFAAAATFEHLATSPNPAVQNALKTLTDEARFLQQQPPLERRIDGFRLLAISRAAVLRIGTLSAAYRFRNDVTAGQAARDNLLTIARFSDWNPQHYLDVGEMSLAAAIGYDWCYALLTPEERHEVRAAIVSKGLQPSLGTPAPFWVAGDTNWTQVCHAGLVAAALAISDDEPDIANRIVQRALTHLPKALDAIYDPSGNYPEGTMYWGYGTLYTIIAIEALRSVHGHDGGLGRHAGLLASGAFFAHGHGPTGQPFCYGDCAASTPAWTSNAAGLAWLARETQQNAVLPPAPTTAFKPSDDASLRFLPFLPLWLPTADTPGTPLPTDYLGGGHRQVWMSRQAWHDPRAAWVGVTGGAPGDPHGHMDTGSFVYEQNGVRWAHDLGMHPYEPLEKGGVKLWDLSQESPRWSVFRLGADAHNILRLPGITQQVKGRAALTVLHDDPQTPACRVDLTEVYAPQAAHVTREVRFPQRSALEVQDRIEGLAVDGTLRWQLLTHATVAIDPHGRVAHLRENGAAMDLTVLAPESVRLSTVAADPYLPCERPNPGFTRIDVAADGQRGAAMLIHVRLAPP